VLIAPLLLPLAPALAAGWLAAPPPERCRLNKALDGDSLVLDCNGERIEVRLHCIDAPEYTQVPWGRRASARLRRLAAGDLELRPLETDRFGRTVAEVTNGDGTLINLDLVRTGHAAVYPRFCDDRAYARAEDEARDAGRGIWAEPGEHQTPWRYRRRAR
jgi:endonuclease YncB( thermonuclease family)